MASAALCKSTARLVGKTAIVTGANTGIGKCTVQDLYRRGARVIMACRNIEKAENAADKIRNSCKEEKRLGNIVIVHLDLSSLGSVRECAQQLLKKEEHIELLINNAGVFAPPERKTEDGFDMSFGINHLGHFLFSLLLLPRIIKSKPSRIVNVASRGHANLNGPICFDDLNWETRPYDLLQAYFQSKLANVLFTKELARMLQEADIEDVTTYSLNPGDVDTELIRNANEDSLGQEVNYLLCQLKPNFKSPELGAQTTIYCAVDEDVANETGLYYENCKVKEPHSAANIVEDAKLLWDLSVKMVGLGDDYNPLVAG